MSTVTVVLHPEQEHGVAAALGAVPGVELVCPRDDDGVHEALRSGAPCLVTHVWQDRFLQGSLRWIQCQGAGVDQFPREALARSSVVLTNARGAHPAAAEHVFGLLLALTRGIARSVRDQAARSWVPANDHELADLTLAIVGLGAIGEQVARRAAGWDMRLIGIKRDAVRYDGVVRDVRGTEALEDVCRAADVLVLAAPLTGETAGLVGTRELAALGDGWLINVGRGRLVDETALLEWLRGPGRGAGLDVFEREPLPPESPLWDLPNVVITPHVAGSTLRYGERLAAIFERNLQAFRGEGEWATRVESGAQGG
jgi:phosphoglycerate dehydrogenase-like enzyme